MSGYLSRSRLIILIVLFFGFGAFLNSAEAAPPAQPALNAPTPGNAQVSLTWGAVTGATGYKVKYDTVSGGSVAPKNFTTDPDCVGAWKLNETSGTVTDSCKTNHGTVSGTLTRGVIGQYNSAIEFLGYPSGNNAIVNFGSATVLDNLRPRTLMAWIRPDTLGEGNAGTIFDKNYQDGWVLRLAANKNIAFSQAFGGGVVTWTTTTNAVVMGAWQHVAVAYNGTGLNDVPVIYLNGVAQATSRTGTPYGTMDNDAAYNLGFGIKGGVQEFDGRIDEAAIFKRVLTQAEITGIMNNRLDGGLGKLYLNQVDAGNVTSYPVTGLTNGTTYYFTVSAKDATGEGANSNEQSAVPALPSESAALFVKNVDYNASGQMTKVEYGNGDVTEYTYDPLTLRLTRIYTLDANRSTLQDLNYTYDSAGNILSITDNVNTADQTFKYDELNRLVEAVNPNPGSYGTKSYTYDKIGNIVSKDGKTYFYGGTSGGPHAVTSLSDGTTFSYDPNGNMVTKTEGGGAGAVTTNYKYDSENRLIEVKKGGSIIGQYTYDGDGGRTTKVATVSGQTTTTTFVGSLFETSGSRTTKFIFLGGQRIAAVTNSPAIGSTTLYYHADHLGGANVLTDATGFKKELIEYEPFGLESRHEKYGSSEEVAWYYFTGKKTDDESGLIYFGARYYDPSLGRFITPDTIVQDPTDPQTLNRYSYTSNNPINRIDPDGHSWWKKIFKSLNKVFEGAVRWLEKVTNSKWYVNVEVGQSHKFQDAQTLARGTAEAITQPWQIGVGVYRWAYESRFRILKNSSFGVYENTSIEDGDNIFVNGILNNEEYAFANGEKIYKYKAFKVAYNPSDGAFADLTESFLQKLFFTSSIDRQLARALAGHKGISLAGHSQGAIIAANALVNLGLRGQRGVVNSARYVNTQISQPRAYLSSALAGIEGNRVIYGSRNYDFSNALGPNLQPLKFLSGIAGLSYLPLGMNHHGIE